MYLIVHVAEPLVDVLRIHHSMPSCRDGTEYSAPTHFGSPPNLHTAPVCRQRQQETNDLWMLCMYFSYTTRAILRDDTDNYYKRTLATVYQRLSVAAQTSALWAFGPL
jgi:hypothetical protein